MKIEQSIKNLGTKLGFDLIGITTAEPFVRDENAALKRVRQGLMDGLPWYTEERVQKANRPTTLLPEAKSIVSLAISYFTGESDTDHDRVTGKVARYAWGNDYHLVIKERLDKFVNGLPAIAGRPVKTRRFVDDGPMNDRAAAERAGIGFFGKNTNILTPSHGSWVFLSQVITDLELKPDLPLSKNCGDCVRCIDACPTNAIVAPYTIDNRRCISFFTIELRGPIPIEMRPLIGDWVFGCDICQDVCPVNREAKFSTEVYFQKRRGFAAPELLPLLEMDDNAFSLKFRNSAIKRAKRVGLQRNVCVALGNIGDPSAIPALSKALNKADPVVKMHAAWALGRIGGKQCNDLLECALLSESESDVITEIESALLHLNEIQNEAIS